MLKNLKARMWQVQNYGNVFLFNFYFYEMQVFNCTLDTNF